VPERSSPDLADNASSILLSGLHQAISPVPGVRAAKSVAQLALIVLGGRGTLADSNKRKIRHLVSDITDHGISYREVRNAE